MGPIAKRISYLEQKTASASARSTGWETTMKHGDGMIAKMPTFAAIVIVSWQTNKARLWVDGPGTRDADYKCEASESFGQRYGYSFMWLLAGMDTGGGHRLDLPWILLRQSCGHYIMCKFQCCRGQTKMENSSKIAGENSTQIADENSRIIAGENSMQIADGNSREKPGENSRK